MNEKEKRIKDARTIEAARKGYVGLGGKFGIILKVLGESIMSDEGYLDTRYLEQPWDTEPNPDAFNTAEDLQKSIPYITDEIWGDEPVGGEWREERNAEMSQYMGHPLGLIFDGLNQGMHLEIKYNFENTELIVYYRGYLVYKETGGELESYVPHKEWEEKIEKLFKNAKQRDKTRLKKKKAEKEILVEEAKEKWWKKINKNWGLNES